MSDWWEQLKLFYCAELDELIIIRSLHDVINWTYRTPNDDLREWVFEYIGDFE